MDCRLREGFIIGEKTPEEAIHVRFENVLTLTIYYSLMLIRKL